MNFFIMFVGIIPDKPSRDFTRQPESPRGLKYLLHTLNAIVFPATKEVRVVVVLAFLLFSVLYC
jgi:hypothetical protein